MPLASAGIPAAAIGTSTYRTSAKPSARSSASATYCGQMQSAGGSQEAHGRRLQALLGAEGRWHPDEAGDASSSEAGQKTATPVSDRRVMLPPNSAFRLTLQLVEGALVPIFQDDTLRAHPDEASFVTPTLGSSVTATRNTLACRSRLQLAFELVEEAPIGAVGDDFL